MKIVAVAVLLCMCSVLQTAFSNENGVVVTLSQSNDVETISRESYLQLRAENDALRKENQMLRRELVTNHKALPETLLPDKAVTPEVKIDVPTEDTGYWMSSKSGIRHNRRCRNYRKVKGKPCGPNDGKPCKKCGG